MSRLKQEYESNGFFGIGILNPETNENIGTLWRSAYIMGASFIFTIGKRKFDKQATDVTQSWNKIPFYLHQNFDDFYQSLPYSTKLIGVEMTNQSKALNEYKHPARAVYLLGSESCGLPEQVINKCHDIIALPGDFSLNVASTGSIVLYDRISKVPTQLPKRV